MKICTVQFNPTLGDFKFNEDRILSYLKLAAKSNVDLVVFSECALFGYYPADLLERESIVEEQLKSFKSLVKKSPKNLAYLVGFIAKNPRPHGKKFLNSVALVQNQKVVKIFSKTLLPTYDIFDEARHFETGDLSKNYFKLGGLNILVSICEDIWAWGTQKRSSYANNPFLKLDKAVDLHINLSASPFTISKEEQRLKIFKHVTRATKSPMIYVNQVGAQDETVFDGNSALVNKKGEVIFKLKSFYEDSSIFDFKDLLSTKSTTLSTSKKSTKSLASKAQKMYESEKIYKALVLGLKDFFHKTGFTKAHLGLSGGVDSALVYALACEALGSANVTALALPTKFNAHLSYELADQLCTNFESKLLNFPIENLYSEFKLNIDRHFNIQKFGLVHENLQARIRADILMAFSNHNNSMLLATSNKTEMAVGYSTLYGDMCGGLAPIGDLTKTQVYQVCDYINREREIIPTQILTRAPSAELKENQKDQDSLPDYKILDQSVINLVEKTQKAKSKVDKWTLQALMKSEFKRWQAPPVLKITDHAFGRGRRFPIAHKAHY